MCFVFCTKVTPDDKEHAESKADQEHGEEEVRTVDECVEPSDQEQEQEQEGDDQEDDTDDKGQDEDRRSRSSGGRSRR